MILDCGFGTFGSFRDFAIDTDVRAIVVSHAHRDHYADLGDFLAYASATHQSPVVLASADTFGALSDVLDLSGTDRAVVDDTSHLWLEPFALEFSTTTHQIPTLGVRVSVNDTHVVYSADTGPGWRVPPSWRRPDLAVLECTYSNADEVVWPYHLSSNDVADLAEEIDPVTTLLTHVPPHGDATARLREARRVAPRRLFVLAELGQRVVNTHREVQE